MDYKNISIKKAEDYHKKPSNCYSVFIQCKGANQYFGFAEIRRRQNITQAVVTNSKGEKFTGVSVWRISSTIDYDSEFGIVLAIACAIESKEKARIKRMNSAIREKRKLAFSLLEEIKHLEKELNNNAMESIVDLKNTLLTTGVLPK